MDARTYLELIVLPTMAEAIADRQNMRGSYLAAIVAYHLVDYLTSTLNSRTDEQDRPHDKSGSEPQPPPKPRTPKARVEKTISALNPLAFNLVHSVANAVKHSRPGREAPIQFTPGTDKPMFPAFHGVGFMGFQVWGDKIGGRAVDLGDGRKMHLLPAVVAFLQATQEAFPRELGGIDLSRMQASGLSTLASSTLQP